MSKNISVGQLRQTERQSRELLEKYTRMALERGIRTDLTLFPFVEDRELRKRKNERRYIRAFFSQSMNFILDALTDVEGVILLMDEEGCVYRMEGTEKSRQWAAGRGIRLGTVLCLEEIGPNAITVGIRENHSIYTEGKDNYQKILEDTAIYFSPIIESVNWEESLIGGVGIMIPLSFASQGYEIGAVSMASGISIRLSTSWNTSMSYENDSRGIACLDINVKTGEVGVTHHNANFFEILGLKAEPYKQVYFRRLSDYIDPLPLNREFWEIVEQRRIVTDHEIRLNVRKRVRHIILTTKVEDNSLRHSKSIYVYLTSRSRIVRQVTEKTGNNATKTFDSVIGESARLKSCIRRAKMIASTDSNVLLLGESGVGKDVFAQAIHNESNRSSKPFIAINCGAIPRDLIESELFGYESGAFTGAKKQGNIGKFELAGGGTLFLDEIGEMPLDLQATLLRAVEQKQFMRIGGSRMIQADVRIISATNSDIPSMIAQKKFRADLYYRLSTMSVAIPPLRDREGDSVVLARYFIEAISKRIGRETKMTLSPEAEEFLMRCPWQGNVRELQNLMECLVQLYPEEVITIDMVKENVSPVYLYTERRRPAGSVYEERAYREEALSVGSGESPAKRAPASQARRDVPREEVEEAMRQCGGNKSRAAAVLGIGRRSLYRYLEKYGLT